jgi:hypothetical protein
MNNLLNINNDSINDEKYLYRDIVLLYCPQKVGSTSIVTSIRLFASDKFMVYHTHDTKIADLLNDKITSIEVNDIIGNNIIFNKSENRHRRIYVIDIYRNPIERKISEYFQKISEIHFNNCEQYISTYPIDKLIKRFNDIYPYIEDKDYFNENYNLDFKINEFDTEKKYLMHEINNVFYIKLRLIDSNHWSNILSILLNTEINIIHDYSTLNKTIGKMYEQFTNQYKLPSNYYDELINNKNIHRYMNNIELNKYLNLWNNKLTTPHTPFTFTQYEFYNMISNENKCYCANTSNLHYADDGCLCIKCSNERKQIIINIKSNITNNIINIRHVYDKDYNNKILLSFIINDNTSNYETIVNLINL